LRGAPDFNLETELASAGEFLMEPAAPATSKDSPRPRTIKRDELESMACTPSVSAVHEEEE
jgi:hypothetical protein